MQRERSLEVRLIEKGEDSACKIRFELGIKILFAVDVNEAHASIPILIVIVGILNNYSVFTTVQILLRQSNCSFSKILLRLR